MSIVYKYKLYGIQKNHCKDLYFPNYQSCTETIRLDFCVVF